MPILHITASCKVTWAIFYCRCNNTWNVLNWCDGQYVCWK